MLAFQAPTTDRVTPKVIPKLTAVTMLFTWSCCTQKLLGAATMTRRNSLKGKHSAHSFCHDSKHHDSNLFEPSWFLGIRRMAFWDHSIHQHGNRLHIDIRRLDTDCPLHLRKLCCYVAMSAGAALVKGLTIRIMAAIVKVISYRLIIVNKVRMANNG